MKNNNNQSDNSDYKKGENYGSTIAGKGLKKHKTKPASWSEKKWEGYNHGYDSRNLSEQDLEKKRGYSNGYMSAGKNRKRPVKKNKKWTEEYYQEFLKGYDYRMTTLPIKTENSDGDNDSSQEKNVTQKRKIESEETNDNLEVTDKHIKKKTKPISKSIKNGKKILTPEQQRKKWYESGRSASKRGSRRYEKGEKNWTDERYAAWIEGYDKYDKDYAHVGESKNYRQGFSLGKTHAYTGCELETNEKLWHEEKWQGYLAGIKDYLTKNPLSKKQQEINYGRVVGRNEAGSGDHKRSTRGTKNGIKWSDDTWEAYLKGYDEFKQDWNLTQDDMDYRRGIKIAEDEFSKGIPKQNLKRSSWSEMQFKGYCDKYEKIIQDGVTPNELDNRKGLNQGRMAVIVGRKKFTKKPEYWNDTVWNAYLKGYDNYISDHHVTQEELEYRAGLRKGARAAGIGCERLQEKPKKWQSNFHWEGYQHGFDYYTEKYEIDEKKREKLAGKYLGKKDAHHGQELNYDRFCFWSEEKIAEFEKSYFEIIYQMEPEEMNIRYLKTKIQIRIAKGEKFDEDNYASDELEDAKRIYDNIISKNKINQNEMDSRRGRYLGANYAKKGLEWSFDHLAGYSPAFVEGYESGYKDYRENHKITKEKLDYLFGRNLGMNSVYYNSERIEEKPWDWSAMKWSGYIDGRDCTRSKGKKLKDTNNNNDDDDEYFEESESGDDSEKMSKFSSSFFVTQQVMGLLQKTENESDSRFHPDREKDIIKLEASLSCSYRSSEYDSNDLLYIDEVNILNKNRINSVQRGLFARKTLRPGMIICEFVGEVRTTQDQILDDSCTIEIRPNLFIDATKEKNVAVFINHSINSNATLVKHVLDGKIIILVEATETIEENQQILLNYNNNYYFKSMVFLNPYDTCLSSKNILLKNHSAYVKLPRPGSVFGDVAGIHLSNNHKYILTKAFEAIMHNSILDLRQALVIPNMVHLPLLYNASDCEINLKENFEVNFVSLLMLASFLGKRNFVKVLLLFGADPNAQQSFSGMNSLHCAIVGNMLDEDKTSIIDQLLNNDINLYAFDVNGNTALHYCVSYDFELGIKRILDHCSNNMMNCKELLEIKNHSGFTPVLLAIKTMNPTMLELFLPHIVYSDKQSLNIFSKENFLHELGAAKQISEVDLVLKKYQFYRDSFDRNAVLADISHRLLQLVETKELASTMQLN